MSIRVLSQNLINQIAAGEVIERPASVIKELMENSLDAGATRIDITATNAGKSYICVSDNGCGMSCEDLKTCILRHATSKLPTDDLTNINFLGFRGEAIPSIASVSKMKITTNNGVECWCLTIENGVVKSLTPASHTKGTKIEVSDLFYNVPARLNFLKTDRGEMSTIIDTVERIALCHPDKTFTLNDTLTLRPSSRLDRTCSVLGRDFKENAIEIDTTSHNMKVEGFICRPTYTRGTSANQYIYVNGRSVKDKLLLGAIRAAYMDTMEKGKFPSLCLWFTLPNSEIDVDVHPQKAEIRFKEQRFVRGAIINIIHAHLATAPVSPNVIDLAASISKRTPTVNTLTDSLNIFGGTVSLSSSSQYTAASSIPSAASASASALMDSLAVQHPDFSGIQSSLSSSTSSTATAGGVGMKSPFSLSSDSVHEAAIQPSLYSGSMPLSVNSATIATTDPTEAELLEYPLGIARGQLHNTYIISQTFDGIVIVDQHACHERLVYEKIKHELSQGGIKRQIMLIPEIVELGEKKADAILDVKDELEQFGLIIDEFGSGTIVIREVPAIIGDSDLQGLIKHIAEDIDDINKAKILENKIAMIAKTYACHTSIRAGKSLTIAEMNELLRQVEASENAGECNHGRRAYIKMRLPDLAKLFDR